MPERTYLKGELSHQWKWSKEMIAEEALKYNNKMDFKNGCSEAYVKACRLKIVNEVCLHMSPDKTSSRPELEILEIINPIYPNSKKYRDNKVKIEGSPCIKGFEIDILFQN